MLSPFKQALKLATRELVRAAGGQEAAVGFTRFARHQALSDFGNPAPEHDARFIPVDAVADLEAVTRGTPGWPQVTRALARTQGFALVPLPAPRGEGADLPDHFRAIVKETADVTALLSFHLRDVPKPEDVAALRREVAQAQEALAELDAALAAGVGE